MENEVERLKVFVGKDREIKNISECLFFHGKENLDIYIDEGIYEDNILLENSKNINIIGSGNIVIYSNKNDSIIINYSNKIYLENLNIQSIKYNCITIEDSKDIEIKNNLILNSSKFGLTIENSKNILLFGNIISNNRVGINIKESEVTLIKNSIIRNNISNIYIKNENNFKINIERNIISLSKIGIKNLSHITTYLNSVNNLCFLNTSKNLDLISKDGILDQDLEFLDKENYNYTLKDKRFSDFGAKSDVVQSYFKYKNKSFELNSNLLNKNISVFLNMSINTLIKEYSNIINNKNIDFNIIDNKEGIKKSDSLFIINALDEREDKETIF